MHRWVDVLTEQSTEVLQCASYAMGLVCAPN